MRITEIDKWAFRSLAEGLPYPANFVPKLEWMPALVPGSVHLDLMANQIIPDPFRECYEQSVQWVDITPWTYKASFAWEPSSDLPKRILRFEGLDTVCTVLLNGEQVATHDNMFLPLEVDVAKRLKSGSNELEIRFQPALLVGQERRARYFAQEGIKPDTANFEDRAFVRKAQYMYGWDWGPRLISCGIWKPVRLLEYRFRAKHASFLQERLENGKFRVRLDAEFEGDGSYKVKIDGARLVDPKNHVFELEPDLWWPNGEGPQTLKRATIEFDDGETLVRRIGLRTLRLLQKQDQAGRSFEFEVNGRRLWTRGANWIPNDSFVARDREAARQIERCKRLGMNMLRVWGGGFFESDEFYDACDESGILVWQDFPYACSYYPDGPAEQALASAEAREHAWRLADRASHAIWCGNNENLAMFEQAWGGTEHRPARYYGDHLYTNALPNTLGEVDRSAQYVASSPISLNNDGSGDSHYWDVWHGRGDWKFYRNCHARFVSEFGFASSCSLATWKNGVCEEGDQPSHAVTRWHDKTGKGEATFKGFVELHYPASLNLEDWIYFSQLNQRDAFRFGIERFRSNPNCRGALIWQFNDCWPVQSWAVQDYGRLLKPAGFELARLYAPILVATDLREDRVEVSVANESPNELNADLTLEIFSTEDGALTSREHTAVKLRAGKCELCATYLINAADRNSTALRAAISGKDETATWQFLCEPKELKLGKARIQHSVTDHRLTIKVHGFVADLVVWDAEDPYNLFDLRTGEPGWKATTAANDDLSFGFHKKPGKLIARSLAGYHEL